MDRKSYVFVVVAVIVAALLPTGRGDDSANVAAFKEWSADRADSAPIMLAQGRCFNGRCY